MKKYYFLLFALIGFFAINTQIMGQCTPDPDCTDPEGDGEYCPSEFPNAVEDEYYEQTLTVIAPVEQGGFTLHHVEVLDIGNIPPGMNYQCQNDQCSFYPATPKCISIFGTPEVGSWGEYNLHLSIEIFIDIVGNPVSIGTFTDSSSVVYIEPQLYGTFEINGTEPTDLCWGETYMVSYTGNASAEAIYNWNFGDNVNVISGEGQGPYEIVYEGEYFGLDSISLFVEEDIYTSPTHTISYDVSICDGVEDQSLAALQIKPNPFTNFIEITGVNSFAEVKVYDLSAKELFSQQISNLKNRVDLSELNKGIYLISIVTESETKTKKIIKR